MNLALRLFDVALLSSFAVLWLPLAAELLAPTAETLLLLLITVPVGGALADFASGVVHWFGDRFFHETTPVLGRVLIRPFREHHGDPLALTRHGFLELSGNSVLPCLPALLVASAAVDLWPASLVARAAALVLLWGTLGALAANHAHKWAHAARVPRPVCWLQRHHLLLRPEQHRQHHGGAHDRAYCVATGWLNPILDRAGVFARIERAIPFHPHRPER